MVNFGGLGCGEEWEGFKIEKWKEVGIGLK